MQHKSKFKGVVCGKWITRTKEQNDKKGEINLGVNTYGCVESIPSGGKKDKI